MGRIVTLDPFEYEKNHDSESWSGRADQDRPGL